MGCEAFFLLCEHMSFVLELEDQLPVAPPAVDTESFAAGEQNASDWLIEAKGVRKKYCRDLRRSLWYGVSDVLDATVPWRRQLPEQLREHEFWAVDGVSFELRRGDCLGLLGRNGAGKSTLLKLISGQRSLTAGTIRTRGRIVALNELGLGFDPNLTGRENAYVNAALLGLSRAEFNERIEEIINFSGIREFIDSAVQTYSSGMRARLGFSVATHLDPDILIVDEVLAVGDLEFRRKCVRHVAAYLKRGGSVIFVAHDPYLVQAICNRCIILERGAVVFDGTAMEGVDLHFRMGHSMPAACAARGLPGDAAELKALSFEGDWLQAYPEDDLLPLTEDRPIIVDHLEMLPESGSRLVPGAAARVLLRYRSRVSLAVTWGFTISATDPVVDLVSCITGVEEGGVRLEAGQHAFMCRLPRLMLSPGRFLIRAGIGDADTATAVAVKGYEDQPGMFTVHSGTVTRTENLQRTMGELVKMDVEWIS